MRIISGKLKGRKIKAVPGFSTRPTSDRLRETIFNIIAGQVQGSVVLDLFSGTGALGIEAISRGAKQVCLIDNSIAAITTIKQNLAICNISSQAKILKWDISRNLNCLGNFDSVIDLVFMDPPYAKGLIKPALINLCKSGSLLDKALIIIEHNDQEALKEPFSDFSLKDQKKYGKTLVSFFQYML